MSVPTTGSLRSARPQWTTNRGKKTTNESRQRVLVFVAGGATYSEVRTVYKVSEAANKDVFLGSSTLFSLSFVLSSFAYVLLCEQVRLTC